MAGIPLTAGFVGKWAVFTVALSAGAWPVVLAAIAVQHHRGVLLRPGDPADVLRRARPGDGADASRTPSLLTAATIAVRRRGRPSSLGVVPGPGARPRGACGRIHQVTTSTHGRAAWRSRSPTRRLADAAAQRRHGRRSRRRSSGTSRAGRRSSPRPPRTCWTPAASGSGRCWCCWPPRPATARTADEVVTAACVVEITHVGSLYHDDVMDEADLRRGADSANARWDNLVAILTGDFLFAKSSELTAELGADAVRIQARDLHPAGRGPDPRDRAAGPRTRTRSQHYLEVVAGKTGSLIATSARYGARFGGATPEVEEALTAYGEIVGSRLPALRRHPRHRLRLRRVRQDPRHRPARGRAHAAGADGARLAPTPPTPGCSSCSRRPHRRRPARRGARAAARAPGDGRGPRLRRRPRHRGQGSSSPRSPPARSATALEAFADVVAVRTA